MKKTLKWLAALITIGTIIGIIIAFFCKKNNEEDTFDFDLSDDDFDLDSDLQPVEREYVPLNNNVSETTAESTSESATESSAESAAQ